MMVRSEVFRGRFRNSFERPEPFVPGEPARIKLELLDVLHRFRKGHRLMVQIQSTWFPLVDRNPQKFVPNIFLAPSPRTTRRRPTGCIVRPRCRRVSSCWCCRRT